MFTVSSETTNYQLRVSGYSGNIGGDAFRYHDRMMFTTYDRDNDPWTSSAYKNNCAVFNGGGFWYRACTTSSINTIAGRGDDFDWQYSTNGLKLQTSRMWLTC